MPKRIVVLPAGSLTCDRPSPSRYAKGCRCFGCRTTNNARMREYQRQRGGNLNRSAEVERAYRTQRAAGGYRRPWTPDRQVAYDLRRMSKLGIEAEGFRHAEIFDRDGWICGICSKPVDPHLAYPDRFSVSLDHVQPLSLGGSHTRANVRCSHLTCNIARGNRIETEALAAS